MESLNLILFETDTMRASFSYLQSPAWPSGTSLLQTVSTSPDGVSFCNWIGHFAEAFAAPSFVLEDGDAVSKSMLLICTEGGKKVEIEMKFFGWGFVHSIEKTHKTCYLLSLSLLPRCFTEKSIWEEKFSRFLVFSSVAYGCKPLAGSGARAALYHADRTNNFSDDERAGPA